ncbi:transmembrane protein 218 isoform X1 [Notolabrus celidotus]|uniref:transmembrane protein 218 isoform X1 n=1 Tax=Notolabrus celidotus TaxID=1203425 RepID=UPI0014907D53|nr:transmembrane protein 218 isoform X1 [Notolabrus celidotus]
MSNTVLEVGTGIVVVTVVWITAVVFGMTLLRASGPAKLGVIPVFLLALTITLVLVFFPRSPETEIPFKEIQRVAEEARHANTQRIVDTLFIGRYILLAVASVVFLVAFFMLLPFHLLEPVYAKALRTH